MRLRNRRVVTTVSVCESQIPKAGRGLFATKQIRQGDEVVHIVDPVRISNREYEKFEIAIGLPLVGIALEEVACHVADKWIIDLVMKSGRTPFWYYLNHSRTPNLRMVMKGDGISWIATRQICRGEELTFMYNPYCVFE